MAGLTRGHRRGGAAPAPGDRARSAPPRPDRGRRREALAAPPPSPNLHGPPAARGPLLRPARPRLLLPRLPRPPRPVRRRLLLPDASRRGEPVRRPSPLRARPDRRDVLAGGPEHGDPALPLRSSHGRPRPRRGLRPQRRHPPGLAQRLGGLVLPAVRRRAA